ncbi:HD domain-containing protein [candidate division KSB1 bacterium]
MGQAEKKKNIKELFILTENSLDIENFMSLVFMFKFSPELRKLFPKGFFLADAVNNKTGGILYPKDTELTPDKVERLSSYMVQNPDFETPIKIKKEKHVGDYFRKKINDDFKKSIEGKKLRKEYSRVAKKLEKTYENYGNEIFANDKLVYGLYKIKMINELADESSVPMYYNHTLNVMMFAIEILQASVLSMGKKFTKEHLINVAISALLHDFGAIENSRDINQFPLDQREKEYKAHNINNHHIAKEFGFNGEIVDTIKRYTEFESGKKDAIMDDETISSALAHIITIANIIDARNAGLFGDKVPLKKAVDLTYILAENKLLKRGYIDSIAKSLNFRELFDFYYELEKIRKSCLKGKLAAPYPMYGFKSPVLVLCSGKRADCPWYAKNEKSVTLVKEHAGLSPNSYGRCKILSAELIKFYQTHYESIKTETQERGGSDSEK